MENMRRCLDWYLPDGPVSVVDLGAMNVNGSYRELLPSSANYLGVDLEPGPGVDLTLSNAYELPFEDGSFDVVLSGQMLEHCGQFWRVFSEIFRILKPGGLAFVIAPSAGPVHRYPVDCYRFYPDSYQALADWSGLRLVQSWTDERGPWRDLVGVFQKGESLRPLTAPKAEPVAENAPRSPHSDPAVEAVRGSRRYLDALRDLHALIEPRLYLEIGVRRGSSLSLASCPAVAIDPDPHPELSLADRDVQFHRCTSDDFFFFHGKQAFAAPVDLAFIDGMHLCENVYRDFINVEQIMSPEGVIVIDDVLPNHTLQASRERVSKVWTGDVWRFAELLAKERPDLRLTWVDTSPTGLLVISRLNPRSTAMWDNYNSKMRQLANENAATPPERLLKRTHAIAPTEENLRAACGR
jgi:SAM-dependent methyltransferase